MVTVKTNNDYETYEIPGCPLLRNALRSLRNPIQDDLNVDNPENYTRIYTVNAVDDASKNTLSFPLERDTSLMVYANLSGIRNPGCDVTVKFRVAPELVDTYNQKHPWRSAE